MSKTVVSYVGSNGEKRAVSSEYGLPVTFAEDVTVDMSNTTFEILNTEEEPVYVAIVGTASDWTAAVSLTNTDSTALKAAGAAGIKNYLTGLQIIQGGTTANVVQVLDGETVIWQGYVDTSAGQQIAVSFPTPLRGTAATALNVKLGTGTGPVYVNAQGYTAA